MIPSIAQVVVGLPVEGPFDYLIPDDIAQSIVVGQRVLVRFAGKKRVAFVVRLLTATAYVGKLSAVIKVLDDVPVFLPSFLSLAEIFATRFACTQGEALDLFLPAYLRTAKNFKLGRGESSRIIDKRGMVEVLFDQGQTKRWDVLVPRIARELQEGRGVLVLLPDGTRSSDVLPKIGSLVKPDERVLMTRGTSKEEYTRWLTVRSGQARLVAGFISAVFSPVRNLGLMVVIEEESSFFRHDQSPFYHAREVALERAALEGCDVVFVSSAPSVQMWHRVAQRQAVMTVLKEELPAVTCLDLTNFKMKKGTWVSPGLVRHMEAVLKEGQKVLLYTQAARGVGVLMEEVRKIFGSAKVVGYDKASGGLPENFDILVATQAVFRHRLKLKVAMAVVMDIDWEFYKHDYQAAHGAFALVQHLRQMSQTRVLLQTRNAADPLLHTLASDDVLDFYSRELALRKEMGFAPFKTMIAVVLRSSSPELACVEAKRLYDMFISLSADNVEVLEPQQDRTAVVRGKFRYCVSLQGEDRIAVVSLVKGVLKTFRAKKDTVVTVSVDG